MPKYKYVFTLNLIEDFGYDGGIYVQHIVSSFDNNKLTILRNNMLKEFKGLIVDN